ncbi:PLP-dependent aminotransferase family protein [Trujillonella endophytica]|uniref:DNA-binding transcriptional regulator, MocR family, contains an aminotransferase domain n=1 Tax=Trujillonella endophytica TaxID=673521 RepID=A0A1H8WBK5_9ACTN|nr:PLP-dependent aminotransferase family protein [Trujillella endophytica]SEP25016.1 DNA-binding transcriptional regulator, MocR family, contains an aminotransferase domain [Trujillella endophytica]
MPLPTEQSTPAQELATLVESLAAAPGPRYAALARRIVELLTTGRLPVGSRLPAERELATALGLSRVTVASAYRELRATGHATTRHGSGTVAELPDAGTAWGAPSTDPSVLDLAHAALEAAPQLIPAYREALTLLPAVAAGHGYATGGLPELRAAIADRYTAHGLPTDPDQVLVTAGTGDATDVVLETLLQPGDRVLVEHPTYPGALGAVEAHGGRCLPVPLDADDPDALIAAAHLAARQSSPRLAFLMPDFSNPTGARLTAAGRRRLAATLWQQGVLTVVDEVSAELYLDGGPLPPFAAGLPDAAAVTVSGLSKAVWGGLRIGWARADAALVTQLGDVLRRRQMSVGALDQLAATALVRDLDAVLDQRRATLRERRDLLRAELARRLPDWTVPCPAGGLSLWCTLPPGVGSAALTAAAAPLGLLLAEGRAFGTGHAFDDHLRLPFTLPPDQLLRAVELLVQAEAAVRGGGDRTAPPRRLAVV